MTEAVARAPGKLFLSGEYVVLMGAPAVLAAVDRYAEVRVGFGEKPGPLVVTSLAEGTRVSYEEEQGDKGPKAVNVQKL